MSRRLAERAGACTRRRRRSRWLAFAALACALVWIGWCYALPRYVEGRLRAALRAQGLPAATLHVRRLTLSTVEVVDLALSPEVRAAEARIEFSLRGLWRGQIDRVVISGAQARVPVRQLLATWAQQHGTSTGRTLPCDLVLEGAQLQLVDGDRVIRVDASGRVARAATSDRISFVAASRDGLRWSVAGHRVGVSSLELTVTAASQQSVRVAVRAAGVSVDAASLGDVQVAAHGDSSEMAATLTNGTGDFSVSVSAARGLQQIAAPLPVRWRVQGTLPPLLAAELERRGLQVQQLFVDGRGHGHWSGARTPGLIIDHGRWRLRARRVRALAARLDLVEPSLELRHRGALSPGHLRVTLEPGSTLQARRVWLADRQLSFSPLRGTLVVGRGHPLIDTASGSVRIAATVRGHGAIAAGGSLRGTLTRAKLLVKVALGPARRDAKLLISGHGRNVHLREHELSLTRGEFLVPLGWGLRPEGWVRGAIAYQDRPLGRLDASMVARRRHHDVHALIRLDGGAKVSAKGRVLREPRGLRGLFELEMPARRIDLAPVTEALFDQRIEGSGSVGLRGRVELVRGRSRGHLRGKIAGATLRPSSGVRIDGVAGRFELPALFPTIRAPEQTLVFAGGQAGNVRLGPGWMRLQVDDSALSGRAWLRFAGGTLRTSRLRLTSREVERPLHIDINALELDQLASFLDADLRARGKLSGRITLHVGPSRSPSLRVGAGVLQSRGGGTLALADPALVSRLLAAHSAGMHVGDVLRARITGALADFQYSLLRLEMRDGDRPHLRARVAGRGRRVPQELSLTLRARGLDAITDHPLDLLTRVSIRPKPPRPTRTP